MEILPMYKMYVLAMLSAFCCSCASNNYVYGTKGMDAVDGDSRHVEKQILVGRPNRFLDASDWMWLGSLLGKLILWNKDIDSHEVSPETIAAIQQYLELNELDDVQVLVNAYRPGVQWSRLFQNREVGPFWRYTLGIVSVSLYTILPGRFFGGDHYNPYTNTISIYSDIEGVAIHEGAHAKDTNSRKRKGGYSALYAIPGVALYHEAVASNDAVSYLKDQCTTDKQKDAYKVLHPAYGTYVGGAFANITTSPVTALAALPGHITGRVAAARAKEKESCVNADLAIEESESEKSAEQN